MRVAVVGSASAPAPALGAGLGLKPAHFDQALAAAAGGLWFEVHAENHMVEGGPRLAWLDAIAARHPLSLHGVGLSLAGAQAPDAAHLKRLAALVRRLQPALVSEHMAWSVLGSHYLPDLLPFPRNTEALQTLCEHIDQTQSALGRRIALENPTHYLALPGHDWAEPDFMAEIVRRTGCGLLLDINNIHVSAHNLGLDAHALLRSYPADAVMEIHLAGHHTDPLLGPDLLIDSHDAPVADAVWALYQSFIAQAGPRPTLIERDEHLPTFDALMAERDRAQALLDATRAAVPA